MGDEHKSRGELIEDLIETRLQIAEFESSEARLKKQLEKLEEKCKAANIITQGTLEALSAVAGFKDPYIIEHHKNVTKLSCAIAREIDLSEAKIEGLRHASMLHDVGKILVPTEIFTKPGLLTDIEYEMVKYHSKLGYDILSNVQFPWPVAEIVLQHHERIDGSGYPSALSGDRILLEAKIIGVADVVDAMASKRPHRESLGIKKALEDLINERGLRYEAEMVDACLRLFTEQGFRFKEVELADEEMIG